VADASEMAEPAATAEGGRTIAAREAASGAGALETSRSAPDDLGLALDRFVGRDRERAQIAEWIEMAESGRRQVAFVTGDAGIGKTTLVEVALRDHARRSNAYFRVARGQCIQQYGGGEPYKPVLEAIAELRRSSDGTTIDRALRARAPGWVLDAVGAAPPGRADFASPTDSASFAPALQMLSATVTEIAREDPLVLLFEDIQWSDHSTLDLLTTLAHEREPARLLVLCTLRPADAIARGHPLTAVKRELLRTARCREILLGGLAEADVAHYLAARFPGARLPQELLPLLVERSDGNPFFVVTLVDHLLALDILFERAGGWFLRGSREALHQTIPDGVRAVIEPRLERLSEQERRVLEAASVVGVEFAAHAVAGVARAESDLADVEVVEQLCDDLARRGEVVRQSGELTWPDGARSASYSFRHALYQQMIERGLAPSRRRRLNRSAGEQLEAAYAGHTIDIASVVAVHFEQSGDLERAARYHAEAAARARSRFAFQETRLHVESALRLLRQGPETDEALGRQLPLLADLGWASVAHYGWGDEGAARAFSQMRDLAERLDASVERFDAMHGELVVHAMRGEYAIARQRGEEMLRQADQAGYRGALEAALPLAATYLALGDLDAAAELSERVHDFLDKTLPDLRTIACPQLLATIHAHRGHLARSREMIAEALALGAKAELPYLRAYAATYIATLHVLLHDAKSARPLAEEAIRVAEEAGVSVLPSIARLCRAWCDVHEGRGECAVAAAAARAAFDEIVASGQRVSMSALYLALLEILLATGDVDRATEVLESALAHVAATDERSHEPELLRLKGECLLAGIDSPARRAEAIDCFERAVTIAAARGALLFELRAASSLCRARSSDARDSIGQLIDRFGPEDDSADLREARSLIHRLTADGEPPAGE
jgi:predicted ATPase